MSFHEAAQRLHVEVGSRQHEGAYAVDAGVLTVWYGERFRSVLLGRGDPGSHARLVLTQLVIESWGPDPRD